MKKTLLKNISYNLFIKILTYIFSLLTIMYTTRVFSPNTLGALSFSSVFVSYFLIIANLGMPIYAMRTCSQNRKNKDELSLVFNELFSIGIILSLLSLIVMTILIIIIPKLYNNIIIILLYSSGIIFQLIGCEWLYKGLEKFKFIATLTFIFRIISLILMFIFVHTESDYIIYLLLSLIGIYGPNIVCFMCLHKQIDLSFKIKINKKHFKSLITFFLMTCAVSIYSNLDIIMLGFIKNDYIVGLYSLVCKIKLALTATGSILWISILPKSSQLWKEKQYVNFEKLSRKTLYLIFIIQFLITIICFAFTKEIIVIIGGNSYLGATNSLRILLLSLLPIGFSNILGGQVLIPAGYEKKLLKAEILGALFNLISNIIVIPIYSIEGAAVTTVISEILVWFVCIYYIKKDLKMDLGFIVTKRCFIILRKVIINIRTSIDNKYFKSSCKYYCPCCDTKLKKFYKGRFIKNSMFYNIKLYKNIDQSVICPVCNSLPRHRIIITWLEKNIDKIKGRKILHFAQEKSIKIWLDNHNIDYVTADLYNKADLKIDIEDTKLNSESVDIIICNHVLEHVNNYEKVLKELKRILKKDGFIILSFPIDMNIDEVYEDDTINDEKERIKHFGQFDHRRIFGKNSDKLIKKQGFNVEKINLNECDARIKPIIAPASYDSNMIFILTVK